MKEFKSFAVAILVSAITATMPIKGIAASSAQNMKMSVITQSLMISKEDITDIRLLTNSSSPGVTISLTDSASKQLSKLTGSSLQKRLQISIGDQIISEPIIRGKLGSQFMISTKSKSVAQKIFEALKP
jgi:preprotein translocase subunit SecD